MLALVSMVTEISSAAALAAKLNAPRSATNIESESRSDIIQTIKLYNAENVLKFCRGIQKGSPVDSFVVPEGWEMPGYNDSVVMAAGAFTQGSSIELSADAPLREPYLVYLQGGLTYESRKIGILTALDEMI